MKAVPNSPLPLYHQLKNDIKARVAAGELPPGTMLPGERHLEQQYGVSRTTVRQAIADLVNEGVLVRRHGVGTYVASPCLEQNLAYLTGFVEELYEQGANPQIDVLEFNATVAAPPVAAALQVPDRSEVTCIKRRVVVGAEPIYTDTIYLPLRIGQQLAPATLASGSIYTAIEQLGYRITHGAQTIQAVPLTAVEARLLQCRSGAPGLRVERTTYLSGDIPLEYSVSLYRGDRYQYKTQLVRRQVTNI